MKINTLKTKDIEIIKKFIDVYEEIKNKYEEYTTICDSIRKNILFQQQLKITDNISIEETYKKIKENMIEEQKNIVDKNRKQLLKNQFETLEKDINKLKKYKKIEELYNEIYYGNLSIYFKDEEKEQNEEPTKEYTKQETYHKDYYFNKKSTITQIYIILKYLYEFYQTYYVEKKDIYIDFDFIKNNIDFYNVFKEAINNYMNEKYETIKKTIKGLEENQNNNIEINKIRRIK